MKKPIIATNVGGVKDLIQDNKTGLLIQSGDESELIKKNDEFFAPSGSPVEWVKEESYFFKLSKQFQFVFSLNFRPNLAHFARGIFPHRYFPPLIRIKSTHLL